jgi:hypothetical protein
MPNGKIKMGRNLDRKKNIADCPLRLTTPPNVPAK